MVASSLDPRIARTRRQLQASLLELARERPLDTISVADIADRADVNRSTFYQHYGDKDTLLADALDAQAAAAGADLDTLDSPLAPGGPPPELLVRYTRHVHENAALYRLALGEHGSPIAVARLRHRMVTVVTAGYALYGQDEESLGLPVEIAAASVAGSLMGMLVAWLESTEPAPPDQVSGWIWNALSRSHC